MSADPTLNSHANRPDGERELSILTEIGLILSSTLELREAFGKMMQLISDKLNMRRGALILLDESTGRLRTEAAIGLTPEEIERGMTPQQKAVSGFFPDDFDARGWGFCVGIVTRREHPAMPVGQYGWDGGLGTIWRNDPSEEMVSLLLTNAAWTSPRPPGIALDFLTAAYAAIDGGPGRPPPPGVSPAGRAAGARRASAPIDCATSRSPRNSCRHRHRGGPDGRRS